MTTTKLPICQYVNDPHISGQDLAERMQQFQKLDPAKCLVYFEHNGQFSRNGSPVDEQTFREEVRQASKAGTLQKFSKSSDF